MKLINKIIIKIKRLYIIFNLRLISMWFFDEDNIILNINGVNTKIDHLEFGYLSDISSDDEIDCRDLSYENLLIIYNTMKKYRGE